MFCKVTDTSQLEKQVRSYRPQDLTSKGKDLVQRLDEEGPQALCVDVAKLKLNDLNAEEKADAESFEIVSLKIKGDTAAAEVRTHNDKTDATFRRVEGQWKFVRSTALE